MPGSTQNRKESLESLSAWRLPSLWAESPSACAEFACGTNSGVSDISVAAMLFMEAIRAAYVEEVVNSEAAQPG